MAMEAETIPMLAGGFFLVAGVSTFTVAWLWYKCRNPVNAWFILQQVFLVISFYYAVQALKNGQGVPTNMLSEENSLLIGKAGVFWALSMFSMLCGVWKLNRPERQ